MTGRVQFYYISQKLLCLQRSAQDKIYLMEVYIFYLNNNLMACAIDSMKYEKYLGAVVCLLLVKFCL